MGSVDVKTEDELTILVTGFAPFKTEYPVNPSWEIAKSLPEYLPFDRVKDPSSRSSPGTPRVRLLVHPEPVRVNYETVRELVPKLWDDGAGPKIDYALHIGMAGPMKVYSAEQRGHRDGYTMKDVDGKYLGDEETRGDYIIDPELRREAREKWIWNGVPEELTTDLDIERIFSLWRDRTPKWVNLRISNDPGRYLCDFIYFSSLAHLWKQNKARNVIFLHVPSDASEDAVKTGTELALQLLRAMVESEVSKETELPEGGGQ